MPTTKDPSLFSPRLVQVMADLSCVLFRRELLPDGEIRYPWISQNVAELFGFAPHEMTVTSKGALNAVHWADRDLQVSAILESALTGERCRERFRAITKAGETRWFDGSSAPVQMADGRVVWEGAWTDISPWMRAEHQFQTVMDHADDVILTLDTDNGITWANAAAERLFGWQEGELMGKCLSQLMASPCRPDAPASAAECGVADSLQCFARGTQEIEAKRRDGSIFPFEMTVSEVRRDGHLSLILIGRDITRRRATEAALKESEERFRLAFAAASLGIVVASLDGTIRQVNPAFQAMVAPQGGEVAGQSFFAYVEADHMPAVHSLPARNASVCFLYQPHLPDGIERHWRLTASRFDAGEPALLFLVEDVTDSVHAGEERRQLEMALTEGQKLEALGRLAGGVAHELNNMLGPILMAAEMLTRSAPLDERNRERCSRIIEAAKHGRDIVRNVLAYCRKESRALETLDIVPVFARFADLASSILPPAIKVETRIEADTVCVVGDAGQLTQVLLNLANNARDAMDGRGSLKLSLAVAGPGTLLPPKPPRERRAIHPDERIEDAPSPFSGLDLARTHVEIRIADTGCGMRTETIAKIFDPFFTTKPVGQGTGLGLSVVQGIVKGMGGAIAVESTPGQGTVFRIALPVVPCP